MTDHLIAKVQEHVPNIPLKIISQGAEALVFETSVHPYYNYNSSEKHHESPSLHNHTTFIIKYRPTKPYRHPKIDLQINKSRTIGEVKFMYKLSKLNIACPNIILTDFNNGIIWMECLGSKLPNGTISSFKNWLWYLESQEKENPSINLHDDGQVELVCQKVGQLIGRLHLNDMIHGDLTSSNIILTEVDTKKNEDTDANNSSVYFEPALIDFGLSSFSGLAEDKAVDLYVLERAILSTHSNYADKLNGWLLEGYQQIHDSTEFNKTKQQQGKLKLKDTIKRLEDVRLRGRKRSMLG